MTQLPPHSHRPPAKPHTKRVRPKTYSVAVYLVFAIVALQILMLISVFWLRAMVVSVRVNLPKPQGGKNNSVANATSAPKPEPPSLPGIALTTPHSARLTVPSGSDPLEQISTLNDEAQAFIHAHATESAIETLIKAEDIDPRYPDTLKNLAETYYLLNDPARSKIYWQRLVDIGPAVGTIYAVAKDHILLLGGHEASPLTDTSTFPRNIYIDSVEKTPVETVNAQAQFRLRATLMRMDPQMPLFDQKKLQPYVIFYQQMPDGNLTPDLGQHKGAFDDTFLFWSGKLRETFGVDYLMPLPGALDSNNVPMGKYYGFVIGIYYDKKLQDARSEPSDLITRIPLPDEIE